MSPSWNHTLQNAPNTCKRIVHYVPRIRLAEGGVVRAVLDMIEMIANAGHHVTLITNDDTDIPDAWKSIPSRVFRVNLIPGGCIAKQDISSVSQIIRNAHVLHLHVPWELANVQLAYLAHKVETPYILTIHGMLDAGCLQISKLKKRLYLALIGRRLLEQATFVHCTAQAELDQSKQWFPKGKGVVVQNLLDLTPYKHLPGPDSARQKWPVIDDSRPVLLFLSRIHPIKGIGLLIDAMQFVQSLAHPPVLIIAGTGEEAYIKTLKKQAEILGIQDNIYFVGHVGGSLKLSLYQAADLFILPTNHENFGFVYYESLACSTPIITTKGALTWAELETSEAVKIIDPPTSQHLAEAIVEMLDRQDGYLANMGKKGRRWAFKRLDPNQLLCQYETMYQQAGQ